MVHGTILGLGHLAQLLWGKNESKRLFGTHLQLILERMKIVSHLGTLREATKICFPGKQTKMWIIHVSLLISIYHIYIHMNYIYIDYMHQLHTYLHIYIYTYIHIYTNLHNYTYIHIYINTYIHKYIYAYVHIYICTYMYIYRYIST